MDIRNISPDDWDTLIKWGIDKDKKLLHNSLDLLIVAFEQTLKELGFKTVVIINTDEMLNNSYKALGWKEDITINKLIKNL